MFDLKTLKDRRSKEYNLKVAEDLAAELAHKAQAAQERAKQLKSLESLTDQEYYDLVLRDFRHLKISPNTHFTVANLASQYKDLKTNNHIATIADLLYARKNINDQFANLYYDLRVNKGELEKALHNIKCANLKNTLIKLTVLGA